MKKNNLFKFILSLMCIISIIIPNIASVKTSTFAEENWTVTDFVIKEDTIYGFSTSGIEKLQNNGNVTLPSVSKEGVNITKIASFAFKPDKHTAIKEYTSREGENGEINNLDVDGNMIVDLGEEFNENQLKSITIPEGYKYIGQDAFYYNKQLSTVNFANTIEKISDYAFSDIGIKSIILPSNLIEIGDNVFFANEITGTLNIPKNVSKIGERAFKNNRIDNIIFKGDKITELKEEVFMDNRISKILIPLSINKIDKTAFSSNIGDEEYGNIVVLLTENGLNPNNISDNGFFLNPSDDKKVTPLDIDYSVWKESDFIAEGNVLKGFSQIGKLKVRKNRNLVIPNEINNVAITEIANDAFRNVNFNDSTLIKYDLESVQLPEDLVKIGDFAFQSNLITELETNEKLLEIGKGAFMNNKIENLFLNEDLKIIDDAAFHINKLENVILNSGIEKIGNSAFRKNSISNLFIFSEKIEEISEMAFLSNQITDLNITMATNLKTIGVQSFANNLITSISLPNSIEKIDQESFIKNKIKSITLPKSIKEIAYSAFNDNNDKVTIEIEDGTNPNNIPDGANFIINKDEFINDKLDLQKIITELSNLKLDQLRPETKKLFENLIAEGTKLISEENIRKGEQLKFIYESEFFIKRYNLDVLINKATSSLNNTDSKDKKLLSEKVEYAKKSFNNSALSNEKIKRLEKEISLLIDLINNTGEMSKAKMVQGVYELKSPLPIPSYYIGTNVYFNEEGKIIFVLDMSYTIGEGSLDDYGNQIENVDEDNEGYHVLALATLEDYEGLYYKDILNGKIEDFNIKQIEKAMYHRAGIFESIKDACLDYSKNLINNTYIPIIDIQNKNDSIEIKEKNKWIKNDSHWNYYLNENEFVKDSWLKYENNWFRFKKNGELIENTFFTVNNSKFYAKVGGYLAQNEWIYIDNKWYWADENCYIKTNQWIMVNGNWFYVENSGILSENKWISYNNSWYYVENGGYLVYSQWRSINNKWYHFDETGKLSTSTVIDGYKVNTNGEWIK